MGLQLVPHRVRVPIRKLIRGRGDDRGIELVRQTVRIPIRNLLGLEEFIGV